MQEYKLVYQIKNGKTLYKKCICFTPDTHLCAKQYYDKIIKYLKDISSYPRNIYNNGEYIAKLYDSEQNEMAIITIENNKLIVYASESFANIIAMTSRKNITINNENTVPLRIRLTDKEKVLTETEKRVGITLEQKIRDIEIYNGVINVYEDIMKRRKK